MFHNANFARMFVFATLTLALSACATSRSIVTLKPTAESVNTTAGAPAVKIATVVDNRKFEAEPRNPSTPSLSADDLGKPNLLARAVGRKRNTYGMALGDVMLPESTTVSDVIAKAVASGLSQAGFRVLRKGDPGYDAAAPVDVRIAKYWSWVTLGAFEGTFHNESEVELTSPAPEFKTTTVVTAGATEGGWKGSWEQVATDGLNDLIQNIAVKLKRK